MREDVLGARVRPVDADPAVLAAEQGDLVVLPAEDEVAPDRVEDEQVAALAQQLVAAERDELVDALRRPLEVRLDGQPTSPPG